MEKAEEVSLKKVVTGLMQALMEAKFLGDVESTRLVETYRKSLRDFSVPAFAISEVEVELRFAVAAQEETRRARGKLSDIKVKISPEALKSLQPHQISQLRIRFSPVELRVFEEGE
jgi:hypothetical protein